MKNILLRLLNVNYTEKLKRAGITMKKVLSHLLGIDYNAQLKKTIQPNDEFLFDGAQGWREFFDKNKYGVWVTDLLLRSFWLVLATGIALSGGLAIPVALAIGMAAALFAPFLSHGVIKLRHACSGTEWKSIATDYYQDLPATQQVYAVLHNDLGWLWGATPIESQTLADEVGKTHSRHGGILFGLLSFATLMVLLMPLVGMLFGFLIAAPIGASSMLTNANSQTADLVEAATLHNAHEVQAKENGFAPKLGWLLCFVTGASISTLLMSSVLMTLTLLPIALNPWLLAFTLAAACYFSWCAGKSIFQLSYTGWLGSQATWVEKYKTKPILTVATTIFGCIVVVGLSALSYKGGLTVLHQVGLSGITANLMSLSFFGILNGLGDAVVFGTAMVTTFFGIADQFGKKNTTQKVDVTALLPDAFKELKRLGFAPKNVKALESAIEEDQATDLQERIASQIALMLNALGNASLQIPGAVFIAGLIAALLLHQISIPLIAVASVFFLRLLGILRDLQQRLA